MKSEKQNRPIRCRFSTRPASDGEALRIEAAVQALINRLVRTELDRQRERAGTDILLNSGGKHGEE
ncbi:MAG: hypothetical protein K8T91_14640 [Planctomycetes bacterium]|nr:hypothetical protein [Planctomycetota bacterium]